MEGTTYYLYDSFVMNSTYLNLSMMGDKPLEIVYRSCEDNEVFDFMNYSCISYRFSEPVEYTSVKITCGDLTVTPDVQNDNGTLEVYLSGVKSLIESGAIKPGSVASIVFEGLKGVNSGKLYKDQQTSIFTFICPAVGVKAVSQVWPAVFKSYWPKGSEEGMVKFEFEKELSPTGATCEFVYGNTEGTIGEDFYVEYLTPTVDGKTLTVDFTGKRRSNDDMITNGSYSSVIIKVANIRDIDGFAVASPGAGTVGSYSNSLSYQDIPRANITYETVPANGGSLKGITNLEFWVSGLNTISFDGFKLSYTDANNEEKEVVVPLSAAAKSEESADGDSANFKFEIPAEARDCKNYTLSLNNLDAIDGYDHSSDVTAQFDAFVVTYVNPANGTKMAGLEEDQTITVTTNMATLYPEMYMVYEIEDLNPKNPDEAVVKTESWLNRQDNGNYTAQIPMYIRMLVGHKYKCTFTAWASEADKNNKEEPIGTASVEWIGTTQPFKFSDVKFEKITPAAGSSITAADRTFTLTFDGLVNLPEEDNFIVLGMGNTMKFASLKPATDEAEYQDYYHIWTAVVPEAYMNTLDAPLVLSFKAYDMDSMLVEGNEGEEDQSYLGFTFPIGKVEVEDPVKDWEITPAQGEVSELSSIEITFSNYNEVGISGGNPTLSINGGEAIKLNDVVYDPTLLNKVSLDLGKTYTEEGTYVISFPEGYLTDEDGDNLPAFKLTYVIGNGGEASGAEYDILPASGAVTSIDQFYAYAAGIKVADSTNVSDAIVMNMDREIVARVESVDAETDGITLNLNTILFEAGNYTLIIPEGYFTINGNPSVEKIETYTISAPFSVEADPESGAVLSLKVITLTPSCSVKIAEGTPTLVPEGGSAVEIESVTTNAEGDGFATEVTITLKEEVTALGKYTLTIPANYFQLSTNGYNEQDIEFEYEVVDKLPDITEDWEITPAPGKVAELSKIDIVFKNFSEVGLGSGRPSLTIDGGEPIVLEDAIPDFDIWNKITLDLGKTYTEPGTYVVSFPAGYFEDDQWNPVPAFSLTYVIEKTSGISGIEADENGGYVVYNMTGVRVLETSDKDNLNQLAKGLYIINGVKVVVK